ncbi:uncharacterized protein LOC121380794 [Gigantopelta aegis]|uniref:uncharacterized protein LOC121380794 n=1 Tax=Gigantopelta aegis TaxID=1735272 RepID=UPI001B88A8FD|nr:uncharacterized protein LOC121380794 [Gigantopelta aegis]
MPRNVEIKARMSDQTFLVNQAAELSSSDGCLIVQEDTFFNTPEGRLKLRQIKGDKAQLIYYNRPDKPGPKLSDYHVTIIENPGSLKTTLSKAYGIKGVVKKERRLYLVGQTRVHVDSVEGLGDFMELEVVLDEDQTVDDGQKIAENLMTQLGVKKEDLIQGAYMDLIIKQKS